MIDTDYINVLICNNTHGDMFDYKKALLRLCFDYIYFQQNKNHFDNVAMDFYKDIQNETDNIGTQYIKSMDQIIFYRKYIKVYQKYMIKKKRNTH